MKSLSFFNKNYKVHANSNITKEIESQVNEQKEIIKERELLHPSLL